MEIPVDAKNICQGYEDAVINLLTDLNAATTLSKIREIFTSFYQKYTMVPLLWIKWKKYERNNTFPDFDQSLSQSFYDKVKNIAKEVSFHHKHFNDNRTWRNGNFEETLFYDSYFREKVAEISRQKPTTTKPIENILIFPNESMKYSAIVLHRYETQPLPCSVLRKYRAAQEKLEYLFNDETENLWYMKLAKEEKDVNFVMRSIEDYLGKHPSKKEIWNFYIEYLKKIDVKTMLTYYSRYCRLFIDDLEAKEKYLKEVERISKIPENVSPWWIDLIELERQFISIEAAKLMLDKCFEMNKFVTDEKFLDYISSFGNDKPTVYHPLPRLRPPSFKFDELNDRFLVTENPKSDMYFSSENSQIQFFSVPFNFMKYIQASKNYPTLQKLYQTCKFFFNQSEIPFCHRLGIFNTCKPTYYEQSLFLDLENINHAALKNITVTNLLQVLVPNAMNSASVLLTQIKCDILNLELKRQNLTEKELNLISGERIQTVRLDRVNVKNEENRNLFVEEIVQKFPKAYRFLLAFKSNMFNPETAEKLTNIQRSRSIIYFSIGNAPSTFNETFFTFITKYALPHSIIRVIYDTGVNNTFKEEIYAKAKEILQDCNISNVKIK